MSDIFDKYKQKTQEKEQAALKEAKKIAYAIARKIVQEQLNEGAEIGSDQSNLIKKIAIRILPKIKDKVLTRTKQFVSGSPMKNLGHEEHGEVKEGVNKMFVEYFGSGTMSTKWSGTKTPKDDEANTIGTDPQPNAVFNGTTPKGPVSIAMPSEKGGPNPFIEFRPSDKPTIDDAQKEKLSNLAARKTGGTDKVAKKSVTLEAYTEVFERGLSEWNNNMKHTPEQYAFARVHSFINGGKSWKLLDTDVVDYLEEGRDPGRAYVEPFHDEKGNQRGWKASTKWGRVKYFGKDFKQSAERHAGVDSTNECWVPSDPTPSAEKQSNDKDKPVNRLFGTNSLTDTYRKGTPGQAPADKWPANINKEFKTAMAEDTFTGDVKGVVVPAYKRQLPDGTWITVKSRTIKKRVRRKIIDDDQQSE